MAYMSTLSALEKDQMLGKIVILHPSQNPPDDGDGRHNVFALPRLAVDGLFLSERLPRGMKKLSPLTTGFNGSVTSNGGLISPQSPARSAGRPIDPSLVNDLHNLRSWSCADMVLNLQPLHKRSFPHSRSYWVAVNRSPLQKILLLATSFI